MITYHWSRWRGVPKSIIRRTCSDCTLLNIAMVFLLLIRPYIDEIFNKFNECTKKNSYDFRRSLLYPVSVVDNEVWLIFSLRCLILLPKISWLILSQIWIQLGLTYNSWIFWYLDSSGMRYAGVCSPPSAEVDILSILVFFYLSENINSVYVSLKWKYV